MHGRGKNILFLAERQARPGRAHTTGAGVRLTMRYTVRAPGHASLQQPQSPVISPACPASAEKQPAGPPRLQSIIHISHAFGCPDTQQLCTHSAGEPVLRTGTPGSAYLNSTVISSGPGPGPRVYRPVSPGPRRSAPCRGSPRHPVAVPRSTGGGWWTRDG